MSNFAWVLEVRTGYEEEYKKELENFNSIAENLS